MDCNSFTPIISVTVPVYNVESYLKRCINPILYQTYRDSGVTLVDDGSNDESGEICDEYVKGDNRVRIIHGKSGGFSTARNAGIDVAKGTYLFFVDSDD